MGSIPWLGRSPGEGKGYPFQYSGLENSMDCIVHGMAESDSSEQLSLSLFQQLNTPICQGGRPSSLYPPPPLAPGTSPGEVWRRGWKSNNITPNPNRSQSLCGASFKNHQSSPLCLFVKPRRLTHKSDIQIQSRCLLCLLPKAFIWVKRRQHLILYFPCLMVVWVDLCPPDPEFRRRQWHPTPVLLPEKSHGRKSLVGCGPWGH